MDREVLLAEPEALWDREEEEEEWRRPCCREGSLTGGLERELEETSSVEERG